MKIVQAPNTVLSQVAKPIEKVDSSILNLIAEMKKTLSETKDPEGVGLAAPQVGKSLRIFIAKPNPKSKMQIFINPVILAQNNAEQDAEKRRDKIQRSFASSSEKFSDRHTKLEGCLSLPTIWGTVKRPNNLTLKFLDQQRILRQQTFSGLLAIIIQHEIDHLNGILFPKRVLEQKGKLYQSKKNEKKEDVFQELEL